MDSINLRAPATTANLASGFDVCGMALMAPFDEFHIEKSDQWSVVNKGKYLAALKGLCRYHQKSALTDNVRQGGHGFIFR